VRSHNDYTFIKAGVTFTKEDTTLVAVWKSSGWKNTSDTTLIAVWKQAVRHNFKRHVQDRIKGPATEITLPVRTMTTRVEER
jgi:hypothetical protein